MTESETSRLERCFIAIELPREAVSYIKEVQQAIKKKNLFYGKFTEPENLHLTLKFLGEIESKEIEEAKKRLREIKFEEFEAELNEIGVFSRKFIKILWIKLNGKGIFGLQKQIDDALKGLFEPEQRFMSHITIARIKAVPDRQALLDYAKNMKARKIKFNVGDFFLKKSELESGGPEYSALEKYSSHPPNQGAS